MINQGQGASQQKGAYNASSDRSIAETSVGECVKTMPGDRATILSQIMQGSVEHVRATILFPKTGHHSVHSKSERNMSSYEDVQ